MPGANVRCIVPNFYSPERENVFYIRSLIVKNPASLSVSISGEDLLTKKLTHVQPSETIRYELSPKDLPELSDSRANVMEVSVK